MNFLEMNAIPFIYTEKYTRSNMMNFSLKMKEKVHVDALISSYRRCVLENSILQAKWKETDGGSDGYWIKFSDSELGDRLAIEGERLNKVFLEEEIFNEFFLTNERLPFRISRLSDCDLIISIHHGIASGVNAFILIEKWMTHYAGELDQKTEDFAFEEPLHLNYSTNCLKKLKAVFWTLFYYARLHIKTFNKKQLALVQKDYCSNPEECQKGCTIKTYHYDQTSTLEIIEKSKKMNMTITKYFTYAFSKGFFELNPDGDWMSVLIPVDIRNDMLSTGAYPFGNFAQIFILPVFRKKDLSRQINNMFSFIPKKVPYGMTILAEKLYGDFRKFKKYVQHPYENKQHSTFSNHSFVCTNVGVINYPSLNQLAESMSCSQVCEEPTLCIATFNGKLSVEICIVNKVEKKDKLLDDLDKILGMDYLLNRIN